MSAPSFAVRPAWWFLFWGLLTSLSLNWVLPALDHHAAEYTPFHQHVVMGAASPDERDELLAAHPHGGGTPHVHEPAAGAPARTSLSEPEPTIIGTSAIDAVLNGAAGSEPFLVHSWPLPTPPLALWLLLGAATLRLTTWPLPPRKVPPRCPRPQ